ncbi:ABC transporter-like protein [Dunaliella salina]|uniref:ABC transporter-like protein n=1 Tax=Dunaliella salina TaxID=3046 RepID=A0ABQ7GCG0_DUNSA|nr:ABC transporter-like protein [Dunaliella salina]|eukprot:KAF5832281.1 ABC transporter-like protein [Dunaliella salina]
MLNIGGNQCLLGPRRAPCIRQTGPVGLPGSPLLCKSQLHLHQGLAGFGRRRSGVLLREAVSTDTQETQKQQSTPEPNGHHSAAMNGNGNGRPAPAVMPSKTVQEAFASTSNNGTSSSAGNISSASNPSSNGTMPNSSSSNGSFKNAAPVVVEATPVTATPSSNGSRTPLNNQIASLNGACNASQNGTGSSTRNVSASASTTTTAPATSAATSTGPSPSSPAPVVLEQDGHIELEAVTAQANQRRLNKSAEGTPYKAPGGGRWSSIKNYSVLRRTMEIWTFVVQFAWRYILINKKWSYKNPEGMTPGLVRLGPTFIKIGQQFSTRVDVLSQEFVKELELLQDNVPAFDSKTAREIAQYHLGKPIEEVFTKFDEQPIAAASLGQVHLASIGDQQVVVKVQRPGLKELFDIDLKNIRQLQILRYGFFHADPHPGNVAVDKDGKLIYYDFGMMGTLQPTVREGLQELFYGVFNRDSDKCIQALTTMGVYVPTGDRTAVRRTADYFLSSFQERLDQQRAERQAKGAQYNETFKPQRSKDDVQAKRKEIFTSVGEDLLVAANDQPFRFPATFTFVVRSFSVLDGIGKSLDARFDISEIAAPYARELLLEGGAPQVNRLQKALSKGFQNQNRAVANLFKNPNKIEEVASTLQRLERGDLKLRVRALETERALTRVQAWQRVIGAALLASCLVNVGTVLKVSAMQAGATTSFVGAAFFGFHMVRNYITVLQLERKEQQLAGAV